MREEGTFDQQMPHRVAEFLARAQGVRGYAAAFALAAWLLSTAAGAAVTTEGEPTLARLVIPGLVSGFLFLLLAAVNGLVKIYGVRSDAQHKAKEREAANFQLVIDGMERLRAQETEIHLREMKDLRESHSRELQAQRDQFRQELKETREHYEEREAILREDRHDVAGEAQAYLARLLMLCEQGAITKEQATVTYVKQVRPKLRQPGANGS